MKSFSLKLFIIFILHFYYLNSFLFHFSEQPDFYELLA